MALKYRVTILDYVTGIRHVYDRADDKRSEAIASLETFRATHPECVDYGADHGVERVVEPNKGEWWGHRQRASDTSLPQRCGVRAAAAGV